MERIWKYTHCSPVCFMAAGIYLEKLAAKFPALEATSLNVHRLLITGIVVAIKFFDDKYYSNGFYSKVGGVTRHELNMLELECLQLLQFNAYVGAEDVQKYLEVISSSTQSRPSSGAWGPRSRRRGSPCSQTDALGSAAGMASEGGSEESSGTQMDCGAAGSAEDAPGLQHAVLGPGCGQEWNSWSDLVSQRGTQPPQHVFHGR